MGAGRGATLQLAVVAIEKGSRGVQHHVWPCRGEHLVGVRPDGDTQRSSRLEQLAEVLPRLVGCDVDRPGQRQLGLFGDRPDRFDPDRAEPVLHDANPLLGCHDPGASFTGSLF